MTEQQVDLALAGQQLVADTMALCERIAAWGNDAWEALRPGLEAVADWAERGYAIIYPAVRAAYDDAGQPKGPSDGAMWQWLVETARVEHALREAQWEREYEETLEAIKRGE